MVNEISKINVILYGVETDTASQKTEKTTEKTVVLQTQNTENNKKAQQYSGLDEVCINSNRYIPENDYFVSNSMIYMFQNFMRMMFNFMRMMVNIITLQNILNAQNVIDDSEFPVFYQALQKNETVKKDKEDKFYETLVQETIDALSDDSLSNPVSKTEEKPAPKTVQVVVEQPKAEEKPAPKPAPVVAEQPKAEEKPAPKPEPVVVEQPKTEEKPAPKPAPAVVEQPKAEEPKAPFWDWSKIEILPKEKTSKPKRTHDEILKDDRALMLAMVKRTSKNDAYVLDQIKALNDDDFKKMFCDSNPEFAKELSDVLYDGYNADDIINYILSRQSQLAPDGKKLVLKVSAGISREASPSTYLIRQSDVPKKDTWVNKYITINGQNLSGDFTVSQGDFERYYSELAAAIK